MSVKVAPSSPECQSRRIRIKSLAQHMERVAVSGAGLSPWEAKVLVQSVEEVYFSDPDLQELKCGQTRYSCVSASEGPGKPLSECSLVTVTLTLVDPEDRKGLPESGKQGSVGRRRRKILRMTEEAREQGGLLTQEDLAELLYSDVRTIRRDIADIRSEGIVTATRGQQKDIGPGVSRRGVAIRKWLEGKEPVELARIINHSIGAVENYLEKFKRVAYLRRKGFDDYQCGHFEKTGVFVQALYKRSSSRFIVPSSKNSTCEVKNEIIHLSPWLVPMARVVFYGDSITDGEWYPPLVETYVLTRHPTWRNHFANRGQSGDNSGSIARFERDVLAQKPDVFTYNMGFNDGGYSSLRPTGLEKWPELIGSVKLNVHGFNLCGVERGRGVSPRMNGQAGAGRPGSFPPEAMPS